MDNSTVQLLLDRYLSGACSEQEQQQVEEWLHRQEMPDNEWAIMDAPARAAWMAALYKDIRHSIGQEDTTARQNEKSSIPLYKRSFFRMAVAAAILLLLGAGWYIATVRSPRPVIARTENKPGDALPGKEGAILTLADGRKLVLDSLGNGVVATQGKTTVVVKNGQLVYNATGAEETMLYNTMTTPRGRQYRLVLPDGSGVWLNAASSITYPAAFSAKERKVTITGEAYFEVAKDAAKPFHVKVDELEIEVLGTHFNINAYHDDGSIKTTLLEGSVAIRTTVNGPEHAEGRPTILSPGQQASFLAASDNPLRVQAQVDIDEVMAWKNGYFKFNDADIRIVMQQLERWYDLQVVYEGAIPKDRFGGKLPRDANASEVLKALEQTQVHFRIEGKKLVVLP